MTSQTLQLLMMSSVLALLALPLIFKWVPPNRIYGFRTIRTLADTDVWYRANRYCGWAILLASAVSIVLLVALPLPSSPASLYQNLAPVLVLVIPIFLAVAATYFYHGRAT